MTHPTGARVIDTIQLAKWRDEVAAQDAANDAEWSDVGRSPRFPAGWWVGPVVIVSLAAVLGIIVAVSFWLGPSW